MDEALTENAAASYVRWEVPGLPAITLRRSVADGIQAEVLRGFNAVPKRGAEVGGILLGRRAENEIHVEDFEPVPCEHRFGPSYQLSDSDYSTFEETLQYFRTERKHGVSVLGFYRSHTRPDFSLGADDLKLFAKDFSDPSQVFLLIKPNRMQQSVGDFFFWREGELRQGLHVVPFPFQESAPAPRRRGEPDSQANPGKAQGSPDQPASPRAPRMARAMERASRETREAPVEPPAPPLPHRPAAAADRAPARPEPKPLWPVKPYEERTPPRPYWAWATTAAVLAIIGGALGYRSMHSGGVTFERAAVRQAPDAGAAVPQQPPAEHPRLIVPPPRPEPAPEQATPEPAKPEATKPEPAKPEAARPEPARPEPAKPEPAKPEATAPGAGQRSAVASPEASRPTIFERASPAADAAAIRNLLERWATAIKYGDEAAAARCYAPRLTTYLGRGRATPSDVRGHLEYLHGRDGRLAINRIGNLSISPSGRDLANVTFRRHWETAGTPRTSGESKQQMTLVRTSSGWKIASEQETRVY